MVETYKQKKKAISQNIQTCLYLIYLMMGTPKGFACICLFGLGVFLPKPYSIIVCIPAFVLIILCVLIVFYCIQRESIEKKILVLKRSTH